MRHQFHTQKKRSNRKLGLQPLTAAAHVDFEEGWPQNDLSKVKSVATVEVKVKDLEAKVPSSTKLYSVKSAIKGNKDI